MMDRRQFWMMLVLAMVSGLMGAMVTGLFLIGAPVFAEKTPQHEKVIRAERIELVDREGKTRASLGFGPDIVEETLHSILPNVLPQEGDQTDEGQTAWLVLSDSDGKVFSRLGPGGLYLYDKDQGPLPLIQLDLLPEGNPQLAIRDLDFRLEMSKSVAGISGLAIYDQKGVARVGLGLTEGGKPGFALLGRNGRIRIGLALFPREKPGLFLYDLQGRTRALVGLSDSGVPAIGIYDRAGRERALLSMGPQLGEPALALYDQEAHLLALLGGTEFEETYRRSIAKRSASSLSLFDRDGNVLWQAPSQE